MMFRKHFICVPTINVAGADMDIRGINLEVVVEAACRGEGCVVDQTAAKNWLLGKQLIIVHNSRTFSDADFENPVVKEARVSFISTKTETPELSVF